MSRALRVAWVALGLLAAARAAAASQVRTPICPLGQVKAGQRATARSVFRGTKVESFNLEIVGVLEKFDGTRSVILARVLDGPVVERKSGVIGGMSGSPVYIQGRLAGAIALTWPWSKEPIAGITPIEEMLAAWEHKPGGEGGPEGGGGRALASPVRVEGREIRSVRIEARPLEGADPPGTMTLVPLGGFVQVSGFNARGVQRVSDLLAPYGVQVVQGPAGGFEDLSPPVVPGAALGVKLVSGDLDMTALGTVTLVEEGRVLGFGHPLLQRGEVDLPMTGGYVHDIMPSLYVSNKMMSPTRVVGRIFQDHQSAVAGEMGLDSDLLPVTIEVRDRDSARARRFEIEVCRVEDLMPGLVASSVVTAIDETRGRVARGTARVSVEMEAEGREPIRREDLIYSDFDAAAAAAFPVLAPLAGFTDSPFGKLRLDRVRLRVESSEARDTASIERVTVARAGIKAGDEVTLNVSLRPYGREPVEVPVRLRLPADLPRGQVRMVVSGGADADQARTSIGAPPPAPVSLGQAVERYVARENTCDLVVQAALPRGGVTLLGEELPDLPRSAFEALRATSPTDLRPSPSLLKVAVPTEWVLTGRQMVVVSVDSPVGPARPGPPEPPMEVPEDEDEEAAVFAAPPAVPVGREADAGLPAGIEVAAPARPSGSGRDAGDGKEEKPLSRAPEAWVHQTAFDHSGAKVEGVAIGEDGWLSLGLEGGGSWPLPAEVAWSVAARDGSAYVGTGSEGMIFRVSADGKVEEFFATGEMNVHALAFDGDGNLYAATSPRGRLFRVDPEGSGEVLYDSDSTYLWSLLIGPEGTVYAGGGSPARIYAVEPGGGARVLIELPAANVLSLARTAGGDLYAGTSDNGVVYRVASDGRATAVCQLSGSSVDALALDGDGNLYAAASPGGEIQRIPAGGLPGLYCGTGQRTIYGLAALPEGKLVAASGARDLLVRVGSDRKAEVLLRAENGLATALAESGGVLYVGCSAPCGLRKLGPGRPGAGWLESGVLDAARTAEWGRVELVAETPKSTEVKVETRSGDSPMPDDHWGVWLPATEGSIASAAARYFQYRLQVSTTDPASSPVVRQVRVSHRPQNRRPACVLKSPESGDRLSKKQTVTWQARDPDKDALSYEVAISSDLGKTWKRLGRELRETKYEWDTSKQEDGRYLLRVTASDALSVPASPETAEATAAVWVDNTPPEVLLFRSSVTVGEDRRAKVVGMARDELSPIRSGEYRVDEGKWRSLPLAWIETRLTDMTVVTDALAVGDHTVEARAFDAAGNVATDSVSVTVEKGEGPAAEEAEEAEEAEGEDEDEDQVSEEVEAEAEEEGDAEISAEVEQEAEAAVSEE